MSALAPTSVADGAGSWMEALVDALEALFSVALPEEDHAGKTAWPRF